MTDDAWKMTRGEVTVRHDGRVLDRGGTAIGTLVLRQRGSTFELLGVDLRGEQSLFCLRHPRASLAIASWYLAFCRSLISVAYLRR